MKTVNTIVKILSALAAIAGAVYIAATYGEQIAAWAKKVLASLPKCPQCKVDVSVEVGEDDNEATAVAEEEPAAVEVPVDAPAAPVEEAAEEVEIPVVAPHEPVAEDADFAE